MMFESAAICLQLADLNPDAGLIGPVGSTERGLVYQWVVFAISELEAPLFRWMRELGEGVTDSPARDRFTEAADAVQSALADRDWLVEDRFSVADVMCASVLEGANARELLRPWPGLQAFVQRGEARPAYAQALRSRIAPAPDDSWSTLAHLSSRQGWSFTTLAARSRLARFLKARLK
jgi:glutathione S-transferase